jgi:hypothetical protein
MYIYIYQSGRGRQLVNYLWLHLIVHKYYSDTDYLKK